MQPNPRIDAEYKLASALAYKLSDAEKDAASALARFLQEQIGYWVDENPTTENSEVQTAAMGLFCARYLDAYWLAGNRAGHSKREMDKAWHGQLENIYEMALWTHSYHPMPRTP